MRRMGEDKKPVILVIDDEQNIHEMLLPLLKEEAREVLSVFSSYEGKRVAKEKKPEIIILDQMLPDLPGTSIIQDLLLNSPLSIIIMLSGHSTPTDSAKAIKKGASQFIDKGDPNLLVNLTEMIHQAADERKQRIRRLCKRGKIIVLMPFAQKFDDLYQLGIKETVEDLGFECHRVDDLHYTKGILEQVITQIKEADYVIADMTGCNPNVFYEIGFAHALNKEVVLITQKTEDIPFDLQNMNHLEYHGKIVKLSNMLAERIESLAGNNS